MEFFLLFSMARQLDLTIGAPLPAQVHIIDFQTQFCRLYSLHTLESRRRPLLMHQLDLTTEAQVQRAAELFGDDAGDVVVVDCAPLQAWSRCSRGSLAAR